MLRFGKWEGTEYNKVGIKQERPLKKLIPIDDVVDLIEDFGKKGKSSLLLNLKSDDMNKSRIAKALINFLGEIKKE